ncbi:hypothetical protein J7F02_29575 [Streptomyces sp. ISL-112]|nr:hypothetical protein [Streptomyces sp. ISL-112]MBT2466241.1 hypothetical protein [Streptomyces sp. ISL-63]
MSDCALILREEYAPNPYAAHVLAGVARMPTDAAPETRGTVILFGWDPTNHLDSTRPFTAAEHESITAALTAAGCTTGAPTR